MKKTAILFVMLVSVAALTACGKKAQGPADSVSTAEASEQPEADEPADDAGRTADGQAEQTISEADIEEEPETPPVEPQYYLIENPSWEYCLKERVASEDNTSLHLELLTEEGNEIIDTEKWFVENGLEQPFWNIVEDDTYRYEITGDGYMGCQLDMYRLDGGEHVYCLDFSQYRYADEFKEEDRDFVEQGIWWAQSADGVLYVAIGHNTYAASSPHTAYLVAINLNDMSVMWKSEPCTANAKTFVVVDNTIVCGYGFTSEPDYLILVDRRDGMQVERIPIRSKADYIICKDDVLFVRTYNTNYTFRMYRD